MQRTTPTDDAEQTINHLSDDHHATRIPHAASPQYVAAFRDDALLADATAYHLVEADGTVTTTAMQTDDCTACNNNERYNPGRGTPYKTAHSERRAANCEHANYAADCFHLDATGPCDGCGAHSVNTTTHQQTYNGAVVADLTIETCAECGATRGSR